MKNKFLDPVKSKGKEPQHNNKEEEMDEDVRLKGGKELRQTKQITKINLDNQDICDLNCKKKVDYPNHNGYCG